MKIQILIILLLIIHSQIQEFVTINAYPICYICGSENLFPEPLINPNDRTNTISLHDPKGIYTCPELDNLGRLGNIPAVTCSIILTITDPSSEDTCKCISSNDDNDNSNADQMNDDDDDSSDDELPMVDPFDTLFISPNNSTQEPTKKETLTPKIINTEEETSSPTISPTISPTKIYQTEVPITEEPTYTQTTSETTIKATTSAVVTPTLSPTIIATTLPPSTKTLTTNTPAPILSQAPPINEFAYPICYVCGADNLRPEYTTHPQQNTISIHDPKGIFTCQELDNTGRVGALPSGTCSFVQSFYTSICNCVSDDSMLPSSSPSSSLLPSLAPPTTIPIIQQQQETTSSPTDTNTTSQPSSEPSPAPSPAPSPVPSPNPSPAPSPNPSPGPSKSADDDILITDQMETTATSCNVPCTTDSDCTCENYSCDWRGTNGSSNTCTTYVEAGINANSKKDCHRELGGFRRCD